MSVYWVAMWSIGPAHMNEHDHDALPALLDHLKKEHKTILSTRCWFVQWGAEPPRFGRILMEEFEDLSKMHDFEREEQTKECSELWMKIYSLATPGTFKTAIWSDMIRESWFVKEV